jgi:hypothetical protein
VTGTIACATTPSLTFFFFSVFYDILTSSQACWLGTGCSSKTSLFLETTKGSVNIQTNNSQIYSPTPANTSPALKHPGTRYQSSRNHLCIWFWTSPWTVCSFCFAFPMKAPQKALADFPATSLYCHLPKAHPSHELAGHMVPQCNKPLPPLQAWISFLPSAVTDCSTKPHPATVDDENKSGQAPRHIWSISGETYFETTAERGSTTYFLRALLPRRSSSRSR